jgi:hypothetical protein
LAADGTLWRFVAREPPQKSLMARDMRGRRVRVEGDLDPATSRLDVVRYVRLAHRQPAGTTAPPVL